VASSKRGVNTENVLVGESVVEMVMGVGAVVGTLKLVLEVAMVVSSVVILSSSEEEREDRSAISCF